MIDQQSNYIATRVVHAHHEVGAVYDDLDHAMLVVLAAVVSLIALLVLLTRLEPRKQAPAESALRD
jgi:hypothetical protein